MVTFVREKTHTIQFFLTTTLHALDLHRMTEKEKFNRKGEKCFCKPNFTNIMKIGIEYSLKNESIPIQLQRKISKAIVYEGILTLLFSFNTNPTAKFRFQSLNISKYTNCWTNADTNQTVTSNGNGRVGLVHQFDQPDLGI